MAEEDDIWNIKPVLKVKSSLENWLPKSFRVKIPYAGKKITDLFMCISFGQLQNKLLALWGMA